jgi:hypothetical protein
VRRETGLTPNFFAVVVLIAKSGNGCNSAPPAVDTTAGWVENIPLLPGGGANSHNSYNSTGNGFYNVPISAPGGSTSGYATPDGNWGVPTSPSGAATPGGTHDFLSRAGDFDNTAPFPLPSASLELEPRAPGKKSSGARLMPKIFSFFPLLVMVFLKSMAILLPT